MNAYSWFGSLPNIEGWQMECMEPYHEPIQLWYLDFTRLSEKYHM